MRSSNGNDNDEFHNVTSNTNSFISSNNRYATRGNTRSNNTRFTTNNSRFTTSERSNSTRFTTNDRSNNSRFTTNERSNNARFATNKRSVNARFTTNDQSDNNGFIINDKSDNSRFATNKRLVNARSTTNDQSDNNGFITNDKSDSRFANNKRSVNVRFTTNDQSNNNGFATRDKPKVTSETKSVPIVDETVNIDPFSLHDKNIALFEMIDNTLLKTIYGPISNLEYDEAFRYVCDNFANHSCDVESEWWSQTEATNIVIDKRLIEYKLLPVHSITLSEPVIINISTMVKPVDSSLYLPIPVALVCEWKDNEGKWVSNTVSVIETCQNYWLVINEINKKSTPTDSYFSSALSGKNQLALNIFDILISKGSSNGDGVIEIENQQNKAVVSKLISQYNDLFPIWSFVKVNDIAVTNNITVPFIRNSAGRSINDITVNLKDTKNNAQFNIRPINPDFQSGYIPYMIMDFVRGDLPNYVSAIAFSKTVPVNGTKYFKGYRLRVLTNSDNPRTAMQCFNFIKEEYAEVPHIKDNKYFRCFVSVYNPNK